MDNLADVPNLETVYVVTNDKFASDFQDWSERYQIRQPKFKFKIVNDGSKSDEDKLGAIGDINFVVTRENLARDGLLIIAGDNLFTESLAGFVACAKETEATVGVYDVGDIEAIKKYGNIRSTLTESSPTSKKNHRNLAGPWPRLRFTIIPPKCFRF